MAHHGSHTLIAMALTAATASGAVADVVRGMNAEKIREAIAWGESAPTAPSSSTTSTRTDPTS